MRDTKKHRKTQKNTSRFQGLEPDPDPEELTQTQATSRFPFTAWLLLQSSSVKNIGNLPHSCIWALAGSAAACKFNAIATAQKGSKRSTERKTKR